MFVLLVYGRYKRKALYAVCATEEFNYYVHYQEQSEHNDNRKIS